MDSQFTISSLVFIVCIIVPGVIFKRFYFQGQFSKQFGAGLFADRLVTSIFCGLCVQITTYLVISNSLNFTYNDIHQKVELTYKKIFQNTLPDFSYYEIRIILLYLFWSVIFAACLGGIIHYIIRFFRLDVLFKVIRFDNEWHYYFTGKVLQTPEFKNSKKGKILSVNVDLILNDGSADNKLISGYLTQYTLSPKTAQLDFICLTSAKRYSKDRKVWTDIPGDCFIVPYEKVIDINLLYNVPEVNQSRREKIFTFLSVLGFIIILIALVFPWFLNLSPTRKFFSSLSLMVSMLWFVVTILSPFQPKPENRLKAGAVMLCAVLFLAFGWIAVSWMKLDHVFISYLKNPFR